MLSKVESMFDLVKYGSLAELIPDGEAIDLDAGVPNQANYSELSSFSSTEFFKNSENGVSAECCLSALWLFNNFLDESHTISQNVHEPIGSYLHGIMHRREGDFSNAKYWFNRAGNADFIPRISESIQQNGISDAFGSKGWRFSPTEFVDLVEDQMGDIREKDGGTDRRRLEKISYLELIVVFDCCFEKASGK